MGYGILDPLAASRVTGGVILLIALFCGGCGAPAPASKFVEQAERLHRESFSAAVTTDGDLRDYVQLVGKRVMDANSPSYRKDL